MKKLILLLLILSVFIGLTADENMINNGREANYSWRAGRDTNNGSIQKNIALAATQAQLDIVSMQVAYYSEDGMLVRRSSVVDASLVALSDVIIMGDLHVFALDCVTRKDTGEGYLEIEELELNINAIDSIEMPTSISSIFLPLYEEMVDDWNRSYLSYLPVRQPRMLIMSHSWLFSSVLEKFISWKRSLGYHVDLVNKQDMPSGGTTADNIKEWLQAQYDMGNRWDMLMLLGDINGSYPMPTFWLDIGADVDPTDLAYGRLAGDDYFPEMLVGRVSLSSSTQMNAYFDKVMFYEKMVLPPAYRSWLNNATIVAGNYSANPDNIPRSPVEMSRWLAERFNEEGYAVVDSIFYYNPEGVTGSSEIISTLERGTGIVSYRGWGNSGGWAVPSFDSSNLGTVANNFKTPAVFSIVCDTGDYSETCFGEKWLSMGDIGSPKGGVAFAGPSFLHTRTHYNNAVSTGIFTAFIYDGVRNFSTLLTRGKLEHWRQYPQQRSAGADCENYFKVYNVLGDPSVNIWKKAPDNLEAIISFPGDIVNYAQGSSLNYQESDISCHGFANYIEISLNNASNAVVTLTQNSDVSTQTNEDFFVTNLVNGHAVIPFDFLAGTNVDITIKAKNLAPIILRNIVFNIESITDIVTVTNNPFETGVYTAGNEYDITLHVKNLMDTGTNPITAVMSSPHPSFTAVSIDDIGVIESEETVMVNARFGLDSDIPDNSALDIIVTFSNGCVSKLVANVQSLNIDIKDENLAGNTLSFTITNLSDFDLEDLVIDVTPLTDAIADNVTAYPVASLTDGDHVNLEFILNYEDDIANGRPLCFRVEISDSENRNCLHWVYTEYGTRTAIDPCGPDNYGYYIYDSNDTAYSEHPTYEWIEIDPTVENNDFDGTVIEMRDENNAWVDLPFSFRFYGEDYDGMTLCSNGWASFYDTWEVNFRNWRLPAPLAPKAFIAPFWDDLKGLHREFTPDDSVNTVEAMNVVYYDDTANHRFIVEWNKTYNKALNTSADGLEIFQMILLDPEHYPTETGNGEIIINYKDIANINSSANYSTVGIQNKYRNTALMYTYSDSYYSGASELANGLAIKFTTDKPDNYTATSDVFAVSDAYRPAVTAYPNPFNPTTQIKYYVPQSSQVLLEVFNMKGQKVQTLVNENKAAGFYTTTFDANNFSSGVYLYRISTANGQSTQKMLLLK